MDKDSDAGCCVVYFDINMPNINWAVKESKLPIKIIMLGELEIFL